MRTSLSFRAALVAALAVLLVGCDTTNTTDTAAPTTTTVATTIASQPGDDPTPATLDLADPPPVSDPQLPASPPPGSDASEVLASLRVEPEHSGSPYDRDLYPHWSTTASGCDTRVEVLIRDSRTPAQVDRTGRCAVMPGGGDWYSPFDDVWTDQPGDIDIDHFVPLSEAHRSGAWAWDAQRREAFANDLDRDYTLIAVTASSNRSKGDSDPANWIPPNAAYHCVYAATWVQIKADWDLSIDPDERLALSSLLNQCGATPTPTADAARFEPTSPPSTEPPPAPQPPVIPPPAAAPAPTTTEALSPETTTPPAPVGESAPCAAGQVKANRNSGIYHVPGGASYGRTTSNVECFDTPGHAEAAGYRRAQR